MELKIQMFAEGSDDIVYDKAKLEEIKQTIDKISSDVDDALNLVVSYIKAICDGENFNTDTREVLNEVLEMIENRKTSYVEALTGLGGFITSLIEAFTANEQQVSNEIKEWLSSFSTIGAGLKQAYTAQGVSQGTEAVRTAAQEIIGSGVKISGYTRGIVTEAVNIFKNGGNMVKAVTGYSTQDLVKKSVGTIQTLATNALSSPGATIVSQLFGKLGNKVSAFLAA